MTGPPRAPFTVWAFVAVIATGLVTLFVVDPSDPWLWGGGSFLVLVTFGLVRGMWSAWLLLTIVATGDILVALSRWPAWDTVLLNATMLALLLAEPTRRFARRRPPARPA